MLQTALAPRTAEPTRRIPAVDGLRAVAVASVVLYHLDERLLPGGFSGVDIFFVISGFVVTLSVAHLDRRTFGRFLLEFYARRMRRILPALFVCLGVTVTATVLFVPPSWVSAENRQTALMAFLGLSNVHLAFVTDTYFATRTSYNPTVHTWSLGVEEQFYLLAPVLTFAGLRLADRGRRPWPTTAAFVGLALASLAASAILTPVDARAAFYLLPSRFWELAAGAVLALTMPAWTAALAGRPRLRTGLAVAAVATLALGAVLTDPARFPFPMALVPVAGTLAAIAVVVADPAGAAARVLSAGPVVAVGLASYSIYLWHWPVIVLMRWTTGVEDVAMKAVALAATAALAAASYVFVEEPLRGGRWVRSLPKGRVVVAGLALAVAGAAATYAGFRGQPWISPSVTSDRATWYPDFRPDALPAGARCGVAHAEAALAGGTRMDFAPTGCAPAEGGRLFVLGDSHAWAYSQLFAAYAATAGVPVTVLTRGGCGLPDLYGEAQYRENCGVFLPAAEAVLDAEAQAGDVLFLPGLRVPDIVGRSDWRDDPPPVAPPPRDQVDWLGRLGGRGIAVVVEGPKPVMPFAPYRCSDWFNRGNPDCGGRADVARADLEAYTANAARAVDDFAAALPGASVWSAFDVLCPGETCRAFDGDMPLFLDGNHVSGHADQVLLPAFAGMVEAVRGAGAPPAGVRE